MPSEQKDSDVRASVRERNYRHTEKSVAIGRWVVIVFVFLYVNILKPFGWPITFFNCFLLFASGYNLLIVISMRVTSLSAGFTLFSMYCDSAAVAIGLFFTGGIQSPFFFIWYLTLFTAGARFGFLKSLSLLVPIALVYIYLAIGPGVDTGRDVLKGLIPGLFSFITVSLFGSIFSQEERYTLNLLEGFHRESIADRLTGLYNYAYFMDEIKKEHARTGRTGRPFSLVIFDLDFFKKVNDTWGHEKGNALLKEIALILKSNARATDTVARYGGEEFVILMPDSNGAELEVAERIRKKVEEAEFQIVPGNAVKITISAGISSYPRDAANIFDLFDKADTGLYKAKSLGRNRVCCYKADMSPASPVPAVSRKRNAE